MATFKKFEEIAVWQKSRELAKRIYTISNQASFSRDFGLRDQIRRAGISVVSNIAEGFDRSGTGEFVQFLSMAKGSTGEIKAQLYIALDLGYINKDVFQDVFSLVAETGRMLGGFINYLRKSGIKGTKFKPMGNEN